MNRPVKWLATAGLMAALLSGAAYAANRPVPENQTAVTLQTAAADLPGNTQALDQLLKAGGPVTYKILVIDSTEGEDKTDYLDRVAGAWDQPKPDTLLLVIYTQDNYDIRFYMGSNFRANGVTVDEMLRNVRQLYLPKARQHDPVDGLVDLINAVNARMGGKAVPTLHVTVPDTLGTGRWTAVGENALAKALLAAYLDQFKSPSVDEASRLVDYRWNDGDLNPIQSDENRIVFMVKYDVLPVSANTAWMAGNGEYGEANWIVHKTQYMTAVRDGGVWLLTGLSTSP